MAQREDQLREVVKGLGGLVVLSEWLLSLTKDLRDKARNLLPAGADDPPDDPFLGRPD